MHFNRLDLFLDVGCAENSAQAGAGSWALFRGSFFEATRPWGWSAMLTMAQHSSLTKLKGGQPAVLSSWGFDPTAGLPEEWEENPRLGCERPSLFRQVSNS